MGGSVSTVWLHRDLAETPEVLPCVCIVCGERAQLYRKQSYTWAPLWTYIPPLSMVLLPLYTMRSTVYLPICEEHANYFRNLKLFQYMIIAAGFGCLFGALSLLFLFPGQSVITYTSGIALGVAGNLVISLFGRIYLLQHVRVKSITVSEIWLTNVHIAFAEACQGLDDPDESVAD
jgi:hypothetical protein